MVCNMPSYWEQPELRVYNGLMGSTFSFYAPKTEMTSSTFSFNLIRKRVPVYARNYYCGCKNFIIGYKTITEKGKGENEESG